MDEPDDLADEAEALAVSSLPQVDGALLAAVERRMGELAPRVRRLGFDGALTVREFRSGSVVRKGAAAAAAS